MRTPPSNVPTGSSLARRSAMLKAKNMSELLRRADTDEDTNIMLARRATLPPKMRAVA